MTAEPTIQNATYELHQGDALNVLRGLPGGYVQCCVTSPPYWAMRDYGHEDQLGMEPSVDDYVARLVDIMLEVRRVLRDDGTLWLNVGDTYAGGGFGGGGTFMAERRTRCWKGKDRLNGSRPVPDGLQRKDLVGVPWRVAFALQADGWVLRSDIVWQKSNPMPESVTDRPSKSKEYMFLFSARPRGYYFDHESVREPAVSGGFRNIRDVWTTPVSNYRGISHEATMPPDLVRPCVLAGSPAGGRVLDPFSGSGTTGDVALRLGRGYVGIDINTDYLEESRARLDEACRQEVLPV